MLFTYDLRTCIGNGKSVYTEIDGQLDVGRSGEWSISLCCQHSNEYEPVHRYTDLYKDICAWLQVKFSDEIQEIKSDGMAGWIEEDKQLARF